MGFTDPLNPKEVFWYSALAVAVLLGMLWFSGSSPAPDKGRRAYMSREEYERYRETELRGIVGDEAYNRFYRRKKPLDD